MTSTQRDVTTHSAGGVLEVAVIGTGAIGMDLLHKIHRSPYLQCTLVAGRRETSEGVAHARALGYRVETCGAQAILNTDTLPAIVFDATSAAAHLEHHELLIPHGVRLIDLTPSHVGRMILPTINGQTLHDFDNINMISCGGQAAIPLIHALFARYPETTYTEIITTPSTTSVGRATRLNIDEYIETTADAARALAGAANIKVALNISPAHPPGNFRVTVSMLTPEPDLAVVQHLVKREAARIRAFCPGYRIVTCAILPPDRIFVAVEVSGRGDHLPAYAGNLDIINEAAVFAAHTHAMYRLGLANINNHRDEEHTP